MTAPFVLNRKWVRWRRTRFDELITAGISVEAALQIARVEARVRQRLSRVIGVAGAEAAELVNLGSDSEPRYGLTGSLDGLSDDQIARLQRVMRVKSGLAA